MKNSQDSSSEILRGVSPPLNITKEGGDHTSSALRQTIKAKIAVFITHGMGQQVPFETLDSAVEGLRKAAERNGNPAIKLIQARTVQIDGIKTQRAEFEMRDAQGRDVEVHVYEGYWAPFTEGQVTLRDVMSFLFNAGRKGICNCFIDFKRWIFDRPVSFGKQYKAAFQLLTTFSLLLSLVVLNAITAIVTGYKLLHQNIAPTFTESIFIALTSTVGIYLLACIVAGGALGLLIYFKKWIKHPKKHTAWYTATKAVQLLMWTWVALTIASAVVLSLLALKCLPPEIISSQRISKLWLPIWLILAIGSWYIRGVLVQYLGDVAAYIDSHSLDRFNDMRTRIKARVFEQAKAVYSNPQYERVALVGHSLGSVVTYDTLNALINHDNLNKKENLNVIERTKLLLTFGSPLDKTAFIFASQIRKATDTREALAATLQPMIQAYVPYRDINWINVYSPQDIISGKLEFYDDPEAAGYNVQRRINNVIDEDAMIPLAAHIEYWNNTTLFDELYANL